jgi:Xaa-Pro aminopeptidase
MTQFAARRARLASQMQPGAVAVFQTAPEAPRNGNSDYPYRFDSSFYYLSGFAEPESVLVLVAAQGDKPARSILFCREKNAEREIWDGFRYGPAAAREAFGLDEAYAIDELDAQMPRILANCPALYYALGRGKLDEHAARWMNALRAQVRSGLSAPPSVHDVLVLLDEMRLIKDDTEVALMLRAGTISGQAHARAMRATRPGMNEYEIEAELLYEFRRNGAQFPAYTPIVAAGARTCILHYHGNNAPVCDGDMVLIDAGCEVDGYASDVTRTYPANGRFSGAQKALYELVLAAQQAALDVALPGRVYSEMHDAAVRVLAQGMLDLGLLDKTKYGGVDNVLAERAYQQFYMHGTGHWLGLDVHDAGSYRYVEGKQSRTLQPGMTLTVEPGIYVRPAEGVPQAYWNIGIRIEDDIVVTSEGCRILSAAAPKQVAEIEELMRKG